MRFLLLLAHFIVAAVSNSECKKSVDELIAMAAGAPFTPTSLSRMKDSELWDPEEPRAAVYSNVVVINRSTKSYKLRENETCCVTLKGEFSPGLQPEILLPQGSSSVFGVQNDGRSANVSCRAIYASEDSKSWISLDINENSYSSSSGTWDGSIQIDADTYSDPGSNQAIYIVSNKKQSAAHLIPSQYGRLSVPHKKPKENRNKFVKASKSGSRVRTI